MLGRSCTRGCGFCSVDKSIAEAPDIDEPERIVEIAKRLALKYLIVTSVTRDDLADGGSSQFVNIIESVRNCLQDARVEVLVPDFGGQKDSTVQVAKANPDVFGHNIETVRRLYPIIRKTSGYERSLDLLRLAKTENSRMLTKSAILAGLGERKEEIVETMEDLERADCDILTIGQYLRPGPKNLPVDRIVLPEEFDLYKKIGSDMGFKFVASGPFVRSSYFGEEIYKSVIRNM